MQKARVKQLEENGQRLQFKRPALKACVNKLPKVGQLVNLNSYEVYIAVKKIPKPVIRGENAQGEPKKFTMQKAEQLANFEKLNQTDVPTSANVFDDSENLQTTDIRDRGSSKSNKSFSLFRISSLKQGATAATDTSMLNLENPTEESESHQESPPKKQRFAYITQPKSLLSKQMPLLQRMVPSIVFKKRGKDAAVQTVTKDCLRFLTFDQGRLLVIKQLREKVDGDKYTTMRNFPSFQRSVGSGGEKAFTMPTIVWNAKIVRVYHLNQLQYIKWVNYQDIRNLEFQRASLAAASQRPEKNGSDGDSEEDEGSIAGIFPHCKEAPARICFKWLDSERVTAAATGKEEQETSTKSNLTSSLAFQRRNFDSQAYFGAVEKTQTRESLRQAGFRSLRDIDNTFDILVEDIDDLMAEIDLESQKSEGIHAFTDLMI